MLRRTPETGQLRLTADLLQGEDRFAPSAAKLGDSLFGSLLNRFPPVEDVVVALDRVASRGIAA